MKMTLIFLTLAVVAALAGQAFADESASAETREKVKVEKDSDGSVQRKSKSSQKSTDTAGTSRSSETEIEIEADAEGNAEKSVTRKTVRDPKGLMNKEKAVTTDKIKREDGKIETKHKKKVNGKVIEDTEDTVPAN